MFKKIAVPLDGSSLAEKALPYAIRLATLLKSRLLLISAVDIILEPYEAAVKEIEFHKATTEAYLNKVKEAISAPTVQNCIEADRIETLAVLGTPGHKIAAVADAEDADLIIMTTHGRSAKARVLVGSIANQTIRNTDMPIILIRPELNAPALALEEILNQHLPYENIDSQLSVVLYLDGSPDEEIAISPAVDLATQIGADLHLLEVLPPVSASRPAYSDVNWEQQNEQNRRATAFQYLKDWKEKIVEQGITCNTAVRFGKPVNEILGYTRETQASLLVMTSFGSSDVRRVLVDSIAQEVMSASHLPVLLVHPSFHYPISETSTSICPI
jgi:nucleotide-binding universal stress UspA family protein